MPYFFLINSTTILVELTFQGINNIYRNFSACLRLWGLKPGPRALYVLGKLSTRATHFQPQKQF